VGEVVNGGDKTVGELMGDKVAVELMGG